LPEKLIDMTDQNLPSYTGPANNIDSNEKLVELSCINQIKGILNENRPFDQTLTIVANKLKYFWQYSDYAQVRISVYGKDFTTKNFKTSSWKIKNKFSTLMGHKGFVEISYTNEFIEAFKGPFLESEVKLLKILSSKNKCLYKQYRG
jgi:hypothetical protein